MSKITFVRNIHPDKKWLIQKLWLVDGEYYLTRSLNFGQATSRAVGVYQSNGFGLVWGEPLKFTYAGDHFATMEAFVNNTGRTRGGMTVHE